MECFVHRVYYQPRTDPVYSIYPIGDVHIGNIGSDEGFLKEVVQEIAADENALVVGMGDYIDAITMSDSKRFYPQDLASWVNVDMLVDLPRHQVERFLEIVEPLKGRWLGMCNGNHEDKTDHYGERSTYTDIVRGCKVSPDDKLALGYGGFITLRFREDGGHTEKQRGRDGWSFTMFVHHGSGPGGGTKMGGKALALEDIKGQFDADVYLLGDKHVRMAFPLGTRLGVNRYGLTSRTLWGAWTGSFLESWVEGAETYASRMRMPPKGVGIVRVKVNPSKKVSYIEYAES